MSDDPAIAWTEEDSAHFLDLGRIYTPRRDDLRAAMLEAIPAEPDDAFTGAELGSGGGWLTAAVLERYPRAFMVALDGSEAMRQATGAQIAASGGRGEVRPFRLEETAWRANLPEGLRCIVTSLVVHHLPGTAKRDLFADLLPKLAPGGALLIADIVQPAQAWSRRHFARAWDRETERQSRDIGGSTAAWEQFQQDRWNLFTWPEENEGDYPSTAVEHLDWLRETGYAGIDVLWALAGHALIAGYRPDTVAR